MKRFTMAVLVALVLCANFAFAQDDITIDNENNIVNTNTNAAEANATGGNANATGGNVTFTNTGRYLGSMPQAQVHGAPLPITPMNEYGHLITQFSLERSISVSTRWNRARFDTMVSVMRKTKGAEEWDDINDKIIPSPIVGKTFEPLRPEETVYYVAPSSLGWVLSHITDENMVGLWIYNSELDKKRPVLPSHFQPRAYTDAVAVGANILIPMDQFFQGYFVPEGFEFSLGGLMSWVSKCFTSGGSVAANAGVSGGKNTEHGVAGAAFVMIHVDNPEAFLFPPAQPEPAPVVKPAPAPAPQACNPSEYLRKIKESESRIAKCWRYCHGNMVDRLNAARENMNAYICTKDVRYLREAIDHYEMAELNYIHGWDIKKYSDSDAIIAEVEYGLASAFYARDGHIENFWKAPKVVVHENKKTGKDKAVATTAYEKREILKIRHTLEKYSQHLTLN